MPNTTFLLLQLGTELKRLREAADKSQDGVALTGIASAVTIWRLENGRTRPKFLTVKALCEHYGADEMTTANLVAKARAAAEGRAWFERAGDESVPQALRMYLGAETTASTIRNYDPDMVHGVLQTEEYARALFRGELPDSPPGSIDRLVATRLERQQQYWTGRPDGATLVAVLGEAAVAREVGGRAIMKRQQGHLRELTERGDCEVMILPYSAGSHPAIYGGFTIFEFPACAELPMVVYVESYSGGSYFEGDDDIHDMTSRWSRVLNLSISIKEYEQHDQQ